MSGGHYNNYMFLGDDLINDRWKIEKAQDILNAFGQCIKEVDYHICGDNSEQTSKNNLYNIVKRIADKYQIGG